jgi:hypothetical protein
MRGLQDVPRNPGRIQSASYHGNHVGSEDQAQSAMLQDVTHVLFTLALACVEIVTCRDVRHSP